jgi:glycerophosphoryl diester phosphodiesterase
MTKIIGHRGAAGLALENSLAGIKAALALDVDGIEFDLRKTKDNKMIVLHDIHTGVISKKKLFVAHNTLATLRKLRMKNNQTIPVPEEILRIIGGRKSIVIDIKDKGLTKNLIGLIQQFPQCNITLTGLMHSDMQKIHDTLPDIEFFCQSHFDPIEVIQTARRLGARGISLNMWLINPITYKLARKFGLEVRLYTVNHPWVMKFINIFYPGVTVYTDHPERFV